jgi:pantetheine-phosphate adenylyltransferase
MAGRKADPVILSTLPGSPALCLSADRQAQGGESFTSLYRSKVIRGRRWPVNQKTKEEKEYIGRVAVYPGSFDPLTYGHIDIVERALEIFDKVILAIAHETSDASKRSLFTVEERMEIAKAVFEHLPNVVVDSFKGLLVDYVGKTNAKVILRGLRATSDFEYEFHMASMNRSLNIHLDTMFMMTSKDYFFVSSRSIKEVAALGGAVEGLVPNLIARRLKEKFKLPMTKEKQIGWEY